MEQKKERKRKESTKKTGKDKIRNPNDIDR